MAGFAPKSSAALARERDLEFRVRQLLVTACGVHEPEILRVEQEPDQVVCLFVVQTLSGRAARTAWITPTDDPGQPEVVLADGFLV